MYRQKKHLQTLLILILVLTITTTTVSGFFKNKSSDSAVYLPAINNGKTDEQLLEEIKEIKEDYQKAVLDLEQGIEVTSEGYIALAFVVQDPDIPQSVYDNLILSLEQTNSQIESEELALSEIRLDSADLFLEVPVPDLLEMRNHPLRCNGYTGGPHYYWWGAATFLNSCDTDRLSSIIGGAAAICTGLGLATGGISLTICGVMGAFAGYLDILNAIWNRGVYTAHTWWGVSWVWHQ